MTYKRVVLQTVFINCCVLLLICSQQVESASNAADSDSKNKTAQDTKSQIATSSAISSNHRTNEVLKPSQIRNRRSNSLTDSEQLNGNDAGLDSAFLYSDQIMQNLLKNQSPKPLSYARSNFFINLLKPRTTRFNSWDDHSLMHFGKRAVADNEDEMVEKRSVDLWSPSNDMHFGKKSDQESDVIDNDPSLLEIETGVEPKFPTDDQNKLLPSEKDQEHNENVYFDQMDKKYNDPWNSVMSFGKKSQIPWDHGTLHFGKRDEPWHNMMSFGKRFDNQWDHNTLHFGKRDEPWHNMMSFGKKSDPWHSMMSFGKRSANPWDHNTLHFGKRDEPWHNMMSFGKRAENPWDHSTLHFGKREDPWHTMMSFGKRSENSWDYSNLHFGKRDEPWHNVMSFGKKSDPWHNVMSFGKKSEIPEMAEFEKREDPWHNMMSFGKRSVNNTDTVDKKNDPWHNVMSFGKKSDEDFGDHFTLHFGKREEPWNSMMSFGKKSDNLGFSHNTMHFGKKNDPWHSMMSFGKKSGNAWDHNTLHFGKREEPWHSMMSFGKKSGNPWEEHNTLHFGKKNDPWHSMMSFGKRAENDQEDFGLNTNPWEEYSAMQFYKKSNPWDHNLLHFGKKSNVSLYDKLSDQNTVANSKNRQKRSISPWESHHTMHFGKKSETEDEEDVINANKKSDWDAHNTMHFGKKSSPWDYHNTMHFGKRDPWDYHNTMHFGKRDPWDYHNTMHFGKRDPWDYHNTMHFGKRDPWDYHNTMHFGKRDPWDYHNTMHFGKRDPWDYHNTMHFGKRDPWDYHNTMHFGKREPWDDHNTMHFGKRDPWDYHNTMHFGKRDPWDYHNTMHFGKRSDSDNSNILYEGKESNKAQKDGTRVEDTSSRENGKDSSVKDEDILKTKGIDETGTPELNDAISINKRSIDSVLKPSNSDNQKELSLKLTKEEGDKVSISRDNDNQKTLQRNRIKKRSLMSTESINRRSPFHDHPNSVNEAQIMKPSEASQVLENLKENVKTDANNEKKEIKSKVNKRSVETDSYAKSTSDEKSEDMDFNVESLGDFSRDEFPDTVLHFGKRSIEGNSIERVPENYLLTEDKRFDDFWNNHNTMHFGKKSSPLDHSTLHFGKKADPWDSHSTLHFGKRNPWDHNTLHFGKKFDPLEGHQKMHFGKKSGDWDHSVMHFGKRDGIGEDDKENMNFISSYLNTEKLKEFFETEDIPNLVNELKFNFPFDDFSSEENEEFLQSLEQLENTINSSQKDKNEIFARKLNVLKKYLKPLLRKILMQQNRQEMEAGDDLPGYDEFNSGDYDSQEYQTSKTDFGIPENSDNLPIRVVGSGNENGRLPFESEEENYGNYPNLGWFTDLQDYKVKRGDFGKQELKRYFVPFQGPKSIVYPHAWFASQIRRSAIPKNSDISRSIELRMAEKKEDPFNSYMHFGRR